MDSNNLGHLLLFIFVNPRMGVGAFSRDFTTNLARSAGLLAGLWKVKKTPLFPNLEEERGIQKTSAWKGVYIIW